jgi:hypothetical protein
MNRAAALILALPLFALGCDLDAWTKRTKSEHRSDRADESDDEPHPRSKRKPTAQPQEPSARTSEFPSTELPPVNYFATPQDVLTRIREKTGCKPCRVKRLSIYTDSAKFQLQDHREPLNLDEYRLVGRSLSEPTPVKFSSKPSFEGLRDTPFDLEQDINLAAIKRMIEAAPRDSQIAGATVTFVFINRESDDLGVNVHLDSPRRSGHVRYAVNGTVLRVQ